MAPFLPPWLQFPAANQVGPGMPQSPMQQWPPTAQGAPVEPPPWARAFMGGQPQQEPTFPPPGFPQGLPAPPPPPPMERFPVQPPAPAAEPSKKPGKPLTYDQESRAAEANAAAANQAAKEASLRQAELKSQQYAEESRIAAQGEADVARLQIEKQQRAGEIKALVDRDMADLRQSVAEVASAKIDPNRHWSNQGTAGNVLTVIGLALGGFTSTKTGGRNAALDIVMKNVEQDIAAQRDDMANARAGVEAKSGLFAMNYKRYGDEMSAYEASIVQLLQGVKRQVENVKPNFAGPIGEQAALQFNAGLDAGMAEHADKLAFQRQTVRNQQAQTGLGYANLAQQKREFATNTLLRSQQMVNDAAAKQAAAKASGAGSPDLVLLNTGDPNGFSVGLDKERVKLFDVKKTMSEESMNVARQLREVIEAGPQEATIQGYQKWRDSVESAASFYGLSVGRTYGQGAQGDTEAARIKAALISGSLNPERMIKVLNQSIETVERNYNTAAKGAIPGWRGDVKWYSEPSGGRWLSSEMIDPKTGKLRDPNPTKGSIPNKTVPTLSQEPPTPPAPVFDEADTSVTL